MHENLDKQQQLTMTSLKSDKTTDKWSFHLIFLNKIQWYSYF